MNMHDNLAADSKHVEDMFATGLGQSDTHAKVMNNCRPNPSSTAGTPYGGISGRAIAEMLVAPPSVPKDHAQWFIPSVYREHDARSHAAQRERGRFRWLVLDTDENNLAIADVLRALRAVVQGARFMVYSSRSATADCRKWRALIPLKHIIAGADYGDTADAFFDLLERASAGALLADRALARPAQLIYLPNRGEHYEHHHEKGDGLLDLTAVHPIIAHRDAMRMKRAQAEREAAEERQRRAEKRRTCAKGGDDNAQPIDDFNACHSVADLLARYSYRDAGDGRDWRSPYQSSGSFATRCYGEFWVSLSASDAAAEFGAPTQSGFCFGDAFDLFAHYEHRGDVTAAVRAWATEVRLGRQTRADGGGDGGDRDGGSAATSEGLEQPNANDAFDLSHDALALALERAPGWGRDAMHVTAWGAWLFWTGTQWLRDDRLDHMTRTRAFLRDYAAALTASAERKAEDLDDKEAEKLRGWAKAEARTLRNKTTVAAVETLARSNPAMVASADAFDGEKTLLGTPGGTVELRTGSLRAARRQDMTTRQTTVAPEAGKPTLWMQFLHEIFDGDAEMIGFMQRAAGYALTGETCEHKLLFCYGSGRNGKSVFLDTLAAVWGDYARRAPATAFLKSHGEKHPTDIAGLRGARLVVGSELPAGKTWDEAVIKDLTGGGLMSARFMRGDFFDFEPHLTLMIAGNNMPSFHGIDEAIRARVLLVPFTVTIPPERRDRMLSEKLKAEHGRILQWAIDGAFEWRRRGLDAPASVAAASVRYFEAEDVVGLFLGDQAEIATGAFTKAADLHASFSVWAQTQGLNAWSQLTLIKELRRRGFADGKSNGHRGLKGLRLR